MGDHLVYVIGAPGVGKSTLVAALLGSAGWRAVADPIPHLRRGNTVMPGRAREAFGGTDSLAMSIAPRAEAWISTRPAPTVVGEGDRLAYPRFFEVAAAAGYRVHLVSLYLPREAAERRRAERAARLGTKPQNPTWVRGRESKVDNLTAALGAVVLSAEAAPEQIADALAVRLAQRGVHLDRQKEPVSSV